jgi:hypothetical protein
LLNRATPKFFLLTLPLTVKKTDILKKFFFRILRQGSRKFETIQAIIVGLWERSGCQFWRKSHRRARDSQKSRRSQWSSSNSQTPPMVKTTFQTHPYESSPPKWTTIKKGKKTVLIRKNTIVWMIFNSPALIKIPWSKVSLIS